MSITLNSGFYNEFQVIEAKNANDWTDTVSWTSWNYWNQAPATISITVLDDAGSVAARSPRLSMICQGDLTVSLKLSTTGSFSGEETTINFVEDTEYSFISARYYRWSISLAVDSATIIPVIAELGATYDSTEREEFIKDLDTSTEGGTISARTITTDLAVVNYCQITSKQNETLDDRFYVLPDDYTLTATAKTPMIVSKSPLTIRLIDGVGESIDGVIDLHLKGVPKIVLRGTEVVLV